MKTPTHREIARACGVSPATVTRALNNHRGTPEATRRRIRKVAEKMGWKPNPLASAYMAHLRATHPPSFQAVLGFVVDFPIDQGRKDPHKHIWQMYDGFVQRALEYGYLARMFSLREPEMTPARLSSILFNRNIPGIIVAGVESESMRGFDWSRFAAVSTGLGMLEPPLHQIMTDVFDGFQMVVEKAFELGYRRLATAVPRDFDQTMKRAFLSAAYHTQNNLRAGQSLKIMVYDRHTPDMVPKIARWLKRQRPDVVMGHYVYDAVRSLGWRIPDDVAFITYTRSEGYPEHTGLEQPYEEIGRVAADVVVNEITHNRRGIPQTTVFHLIRGRWVDGRTAPPRFIRNVDAEEIKRLPK